MSEDCSKCRCVIYLAEGYCRPIVDGEIYCTTCADKEIVRLAALLAAKAAECERLRACLEGTGHRLASWAEQADLIRLGIDGVRGGITAALAPPAGEGGGYVDLNKGKDA